ncbi:sensor histidine kinase [Flavobacterium stagni]|uniref:Histidine kinase n=1 Tax=Flavobacterium stagni TaxID=2506421 RepID=A0A4V1N2R1_9FLAO|nr:histidine kinase [Flavobacterium stagni]RXR22991.1 histidine kinase [Flavobacterium stagni]
MNKQSRSLVNKDFILHGTLWVIISLLLGLPNYLNQHFSLGIFIAEWITYVVLFYFNYLFLVPKFLLKGKYLFHFILLLGLIVFFTEVRIHFFLDDLKLMRPPHSVIVEGKKILLQPMKQPPGPPFFLNVAMSFSYIFIVLISTIIKVLYEYNHNFQNRLLAETERKSAELNYLRKQTNPHFLFNSLNSIYSLAIKKSDQVGDAIVTLSELMRYMLYETDQRVVPLEKEINYIVNYIELQKLRIHDIENIRVNIYGDLKEKMIEPLLLISFIENAFKYGTDYKGKTDVRLKITVQESLLEFYIENKISRHTEDPVHSGIGVQNIKSRLELLYPKSHELTIIHVDGKYQVHLKLNLEENNPSY